MTRESCTKYLGRMGLSSVTRTRAVLFYSVSIVNLKEICVSELIKSHETVPYSYFTVPGMIEKGDLSGCNARFRLE